MSTNRQVEPHCSDPRAATCPPPVQPTVVLDSEASWPERRSHAARAGECNARLPVRCRVGRTVPRRNYDHSPGRRGGRSPPPGQPDPCSRATSRCPLHRQTRRRVQQHERARILLSIAVCSGQPAQPRIRDRVVTGRNPFIQPTSFGVLPLSRPIADIVRRRRPVTRKTSAQRMTVTTGRTSTLQKSRTSVVLWGGPTLCSARYCFDGGVT